MTEKRKYEKPSTRVIELQHRTMLLAGSAQVNTTMNGVFVEQDLAPQLQLPGDLIAPGFMLPE